MGKANSTGILSVRGKDHGLSRPVVSYLDAVLPTICSWLPVLLLSRIPQNSVSLGTTLASLQNLVADEYASLRGAQARASLLPGIFPSQSFVVAVLLCRCDQDHSRSFEC